MTKSVPRASKTRGKKNPKQEPVQVLLILDKSGSMSFAAEAARSAINEYVQSLAADGNVYKMTLLLFDTQVQVFYEDKSPKTAPKLTDVNYRPGGTTALNDAIGTGLKQMRDRFATSECPYGKGRFLCIIETDGQENSSKEYSHSAIVQAIAEHTAAGNWTFAYLGASQDAWLGGDLLGIPKGNQLNFTGTDYEQTFQTASASSTAYSSSGEAQTRNLFTSQS